MFADIFKKIGYSGTHYELSAEGQLRQCVGCPKRQVEILVRINCEMKLHVTDE